MGGVKRAAGVAGLIVLAGAVALLVQRISLDRQYQQLMTQGEAALQSGQSYVAVEIFSGALALRPGSMAAYYRRGEAYRDQHLDERAIRDLREAARLAPNAPEPLVALGRLFDDRGSPAEAAEWYRQAADRLRDADPTLLYTLAMALYRSGSPAAALEPLRRALARDEGVAEAHYLLGLVYRDAQNIEAATASLEQAVRLAPGLVAAHEELADIYREQGRSGDEQAQLAILATLDPQPDRRIALALADIRRQDPDHALVILEHESALSPHDSRIQLAIGRALLARSERTGDRASARRALSALERALGGTAPRSEGLALFGRALYLSGDAAAAERMLQEAVATSPVDPEAFQFLADAAESLTHSAIARDALLDLDVLEGDAASVEVRGARARRLGALSLSLNDPRAALTYLTQANDAGWSDAPTLGLLARARWQTGDQAGARAALAAALALNADDRDLRRLTRTIR
jgi:tetratricopeptide (TPR) repeat protein